MVVCFTLTVGFAAPTDSLLNSWDDALSDSSKQELVADISREAYFSGRYALSIALADSIPQKHPEAVSAHLFLWAGVSLQEISEFDSAENMLNRALSSASVDKNDTLLGKSYQYLGDLSNSRGNLQLAFQYYDSALSKFKAINHRRNLAAINNSYGVAYANIGNHEKALEYYFNAAEYFRDLEDKRNEAVIIGNIVQEYVELGELSKALDHGRKAIAVARDMGSPADLSRVYINYSLVLQKDEEYDSATYYLQQARSIMEQIGNRRSLAVIYYNLGEVYLEERQLAKAVEHYKACLELSRAADILIGKFYGNIGLSKAYLELEQFAVAREAATSALEYAAQIASPSLIANAHHSLYQINKLAGDSRSALENFEMYKATSDSLEDLQSNREIENLKSSYELKIRESENQLLTERFSLAEQQLTNNRMYILIIVVALGIAVIALIILGFNLYNQKKSKSRLEEQKETIKANNTALKELNDELSETNELKNRLLSILSHDLRGPLRSLKALIDMHKNEQMSSQELETYINKLDTDLIQVLAFTDNLLSWAKSQMKGLNVNKSDFKLEEIYREAESLLAPYAKEKGINLHLRSSGEHTVHADRDMISLAFRNILSNALKFTHPEGKVATVIEKDKDQVQIRISDDGIGMSDQQIENFHQNKMNSSKGTNNEKGMGLGLILSKSFVQMHLGRIDIESGEGKGTTFIISLPDS